MYTQPQAPASRLPAITVPQLRARKGGEKIVAITAYDATFARAADQAGIDWILVGDSLGMVVQGRDNTLSVSVADIVYHTRAVCSATQRALVVADMPFGSYGDAQSAYANAVPCIAAGAEMVKMEGAGHVLDCIAYLSAREVPVCAHLGLTPQAVHRMGGYKVQGREQSQAEQLLEDAKRCANAGADMLVLECVPQALAARISEAVEIPTIGIGAGAHCDGQILVNYDALGLDGGHRRPRFVKNFLQGRDNVLAAFQAYVEEVRSGAFPTAEHAYD